MKREHLVLVGNGMAGMRTIEELLERAPDLYDITVFGDEPYGNYNRILLSSMLAGEKGLEAILLNDTTWYAERGITLRTNARIAQIDRGRRQVIDENGRRVAYDRLILATGSLPVVLPLPGAQLPGVVTFRSVSDVEAMLARTKPGGRAVVIGGGLLGLEAASGLAARGMAVSVVHLAATLMERQVDAMAGALLQRELERRGITFHLGSQTETVLGSDQVVGVRLQSGLELPADLVVMAVGIRPNIALAKAAGLYCERGVVVDDTLQTFDPRVYAVGECAQHRGETYGIVAPLFEQAKVCANHLAQVGTQRYRGSRPATKLKVSGIDLFSAGDIRGGEEVDELIFSDPARGVYKKLLLEEGRIRGAVLYGDTLDGARYFQLLRDGTDVSGMREHLLFGSSGGAEQGASVADLPDDAEICGCNGVTKGAIVRAITEQKLFTLEAVRSHTKASASCGSCTAQVEALLSSTLGGDYSPSPKRQALCDCTDYTHEEVRRAIREQELHSIPEVTAFMEWRTPDGCKRCRPALNYYLLCQWPGSYADDPQSRFINERVHANIQKDGTYSVVPRIWGGVTTPAELRAIAEVAEKYRVPTVKITGGQRIDLLGVPKEQLPNIWHDLARHGFVSGHAYGKALRTVKTCVGKEWCRFGTQDSTAMGIELEKMTWGAWMPHKVKLAVSGCPRNCAEATIKDLGIIAVESGWELHVGGNGGVKVRVTDFLCKVESVAQVREYCAAFLQLYAEEAHYLERTAAWVERVGIAYVRQQLLDDAERRRVLAERFLAAQRHVQRDPWEARADGAEGHEFTPWRDFSNNSTAVEEGTRCLG